MLQDTPESTPASTPGPPSGLRARKRAAAMRHIQGTALDLFDRNGFDGVTVEQVAVAAEVSPSSIYRYFGSKEGLIVHDEYDEWLLTAARRHLATHDVLDAVALTFAEVGQSHFVDGVGLTLRRLPYLVVPSIRGATHLAVEEVVDELAAELARPGRVPERTLIEARTVVCAVLWGLLGAMTAWFEAGAEGSLLDAVTEGLHALRTI